MNKKYILMGLSSILALGSLAADEQVDELEHASIQLLKPIEILGPNPEVMERIKAEQERKLEEALAEMEKMSAELALQHQMMLQREQASRVTGLIIERVDLDKLDRASREAILKEILRVIKFRLNSMSTQQLQRVLQDLLAAHNEMDDELSFL